jgi:hypothetical protein
LDSTRYELDLEKQVNGLLLAWTRWTSYVFIFTSTVVFVSLRGKTKGDYSVKLFNISYYLRCVALFFICVIALSLLHIWWWNPDIDTKSTHIVIDLLRIHAEYLHLLSHK